MTDQDELPAISPAPLPRVPFYIVVQKTAKKSIEESYNSPASKIVGRIHFICGAVSFFAGVCLLINFNGVPHVSQVCRDWQCNSKMPISRPTNVERFGAGIWCSVIFFLVGFLGMFSANKKSSRLIITTMVVGIFAAMFAVVLVIFSAVGLGQSSSFHQTEYATAIGMYTLQLVIGIIELVLAIISSSLSCKATCCRDMVDTTSQSSKVMFSPSGGLEPDQIVHLAKQMQDEPSSPLPPSYEDLARVEKGKGDY